MNKLFCGECKKLLNYINRNEDELVSYETCEDGDEELPYRQKCMSCGLITRHIKKL